MATYARARMDALEPVLIITIVTKTTSDDTINSIHEMHGICALCTPESDVTHFPSSIQYMITRTATSKVIFFFHLQHTLLSYFYSMAKINDKSNAHHTVL